MRLGARRRLRRQHPNRLQRRWFRWFRQDGRVDPVALLREMKHPDSPFGPGVQRLQVRHLWHNREEFTLVGEVIKPVS